MKIADREGILEKRIRDMMKYKVLIIDEIGYLPFDEEGAHCLFQLVSRRYEKSSTILTSNKSYGEWGEIFKDHVIAAALLDRIQDSDKPPIFIDRSSAIYRTKSKGFSKSSILI